MERLTKRLEDGQAVFHECHGTCGTCDGANCYCIGPMVDRLAAYEDLMERWKLRSIEEADRIFHRVNALGGIDLMAQYRKLGPIEHLRELIRAEQDGRLVVLPCKVGDHVWADGREAIAVWFFGYKTERYLHAQFLDNAEYTDIPFYEIGKTVFLDREEAEAVLKGGEG